MGILSDALAGSGKSLKPDNVGDTVGGTITAVEVTNYTNFETGDVETWTNGDPKQQMNISVTDDATGEPMGIYVKLWGYGKKNLAAAVDATGLEADAALAPGSHISMTFDREEPNMKNPRLNATKVYTFVITPRANIGNALTTPAAPAPQAPAPAAPAAAAPAAAAPAPAAAVAPAGGVDIPQLIAAGLPDDQIATIAGVDAVVVAAIRATTK